MVVALFGLVLLAAALIRSAIVFPLPLAAGLTGLHAALAHGAGPLETVGVFATAVMVSAAALQALREAPGASIRWRIRTIEATASCAMTAGVVLYAVRLLN